MNEVARCIFLPHFFDEGARTRRPIHGVVTVAPFCAPLLLFLHIGIATYKALSLWVAVSPVHNKASHFFVFTFTSSERLRERDR